MAYHLETYLARYRNLYKNNLNKTLRKQNRDLYTFEPWKFNSWSTLWHIDRFEGIRSILKSDLELGLRK